jgi:hypothetical protein
VTWFIVGLTEFVSAPGQKGEKCHAFKVSLGKRGAVGPVSGGRMLLSSPELLPASGGRPLGALLPSSGTLLWRSVGSGSGRGGPERSGV